MLVHIGPLAIRWYALAYIVGILLGWVYARALVRSERLWGGRPPITVADFDDFVLWVTLGIILGGRIGYVLFYNLPHLRRASAARSSQLWNGGMSFHGGFIGCVVAVILFARSRGIPILSLGDVTCAVGPIGLFLGRIANFINGELWGRPTDVPWAMVFPSGGPIPRHPSQLYEAGLEGLVLFDRPGDPHPLGALKRPGLIIGAFAVVYALRAFVLANSSASPTRNSASSGAARPWAMLLSIPLFLAGIGFIAYAVKRPARRRRPDGDDRRSKRKSARASRSPGRCRSAEYMALCLADPRARLLHDARPVRRRAAISSPRRKSARCSAS